MRTEDDPQKYWTTYQSIISTSPQILSSLSPPEVHLLLKRATSSKYTDPDSTTTSTPPSTLSSSIRIERIIKTISDLLSANNPPSDRMIQRCLPNCATRYEDAVRLLDLLESRTPILSSDRVYGELINGVGKKNVGGAWRLFRRMNHWRKRSGSEEGKSEKERDAGSLELFAQIEYEIARFLGRSFTKAKTPKPLSNDTAPTTGPRSYTHLTLVLYRFRLLTSLLHLHTHLTTYTPFTPSTRMYNHLLLAVSELSTTGRKEGCGMSVSTVLEEMQRNGVRVSSMIFEALMMHFVREGYSERAVRVLEGVYGFRPESSEDGGGGGEGGGEEVDELDVLRDLAGGGVTPTVYTFNIGMLAYLKRGRVEEAMGLRVRMKELGIEPTDVTYRILLDGIAKSGKPDLARTLLSDTSLPPTVANVISYTALIDTYVNAHDLDTAEEVYEEMLQ
ncbi:hypothetical protein HK097_011696, partial [Rhizophlyctis rosea]